ncbi:MAG TPA: dTDP-glucose 4,6-dehydratase [Steroidobacteraceae bacterium]|nr:dTDP-glucose 4,6-dehydratase [Steroidobacteraceae bacterium]
MRRLLVTGGAGFIGANFCHHWCASHPADRIVVLDALTYAGNLASIGALIDSGRLRFVHGDIGERERVAALLAEEAIDTVVNFAAESHVDRSIEDPAQFLRTNVLGTQSLLDAARSTWGPEAARRGCRFHHVSTDEVYGSLAPGEAAFTESTAYAPNSPYAASKAAADHLVRACAHTFGLPCTISNCSNNYGPYQFPEKLLPLCILNILEGRPLPIYGDGLQIRDWLHVSDHCRALELILMRSEAGETWNVGGATQDPNLTVVATVCDLLDRAFAAEPALKGRYPRSAPAQGRSARTLIRHVRDRPGHDRRYAVDAEKIRRRFGFSPATTLSQGLAATVRWYLENEDWWRGVVSGDYRQWYARQYAAQPAADRDEAQRR